LISEIQLTANRSGFEEVMIQPLIFFIILSLAFVLIAKKSIAVAQEDERLVVLRLGQLIGVYGPGLNVVIPFIDRVIRVKVESIAGWRELSENGLQKKAAEIALETGN
jgi:regulator of protease activity HflC (stomatin/prohibitin superfamily)